MSTRTTTFDTIFYRDLIIIIWSIATLFWFNILKIKDIMQQVWPNTILFKVVFPEYFEQICARFAIYFAFSFYEKKIHLNLKFNLNFLSFVFCKNHWHEISLFTLKERKKDCNIKVILLTFSLNFSEDKFPFWGLKAKQL